MAAAFTNERAQECAAHLAFLLHEGGPMTRSQIASALSAASNFSAGQIQWVLIRMQKLGLVERTGTNLSFVDAGRDLNLARIAQVDGRLEEPEPFESVLVQQQILEAQQRMADALEAIQARLERMHD